MAADGAWPGAQGAGIDGPQRTAADLRAVMAELERRLAARSPAPLRPQSAAALARALDALGGQVMRLEETTADRHAPRTGALQGVAAGLDAQAQIQAGPAADLGEARARPAPGPEPWPIRLLLTLSGGAAAVAVMSAGALLLAQPEALPRGVARPLQALSQDLPLRPGLPDGSPAKSSTPRTTLPPSQPPPAVVARDTYVAAVAALARGEATALARLTGLAEAGDAQAQRHLASLYEGGSGGLVRDPGAARAWTERAARGGDRVAMHNLALFLANGEGGPRDAVQAAAWFRRAAERGVVDSQYNLGLIYEAGRGVDRNLREAYRWFAVAANAGDLQAREKQVELEGRLAAGERAGLDREAAGFQPGAPSPGPALALIIPPATTLVETQTMLARQGYYVGPADGLSSAALRTAAQAYLRDHPGAISTPTPGTL
jgi:localization factor PodJL